MQLDTDRNAHRRIQVRTRAQGHATPEGSQTHPGLPTLYALHQHQTAHPSTAQIHNSTSTHTQGGTQAGARSQPRTHGVPSAHLPSVGPEGEAALPAAHGTAAAAAARPARAAPEPPSPRPGHLGNPGRPAPGHKPRDCPRPRGLRSSGPGQPGAERAACSRRPRAGGGSFAGLSELGPQGRRAGLWAVRDRPSIPQTRGVPGGRPSPGGDTLFHPAPEPLGSVGGPVPRHHEGALTEGQELGIQGQNSLPRGQVSALPVPGISHL